MIHIVDGMEAADLHHLTVIDFQTNGAILVAHHQGVLQIAFTLTDIVGVAQAMAQAQHLNYEVLLLLLIDQIVADHGQTFQQLQ